MICTVRFDQVLGECVAIAKLEIAVDEVLAGKP